MPSRSTLEYHISHAELVREDRHGNAGATVLFGWLMRPTMIHGSTHMHPETGDSLDIKCAAEIRLSPWRRGIHTDDIAFLADLMKTEAGSFVR